MTNQEISEFFAEIAGLMKPENEQDIFKIRAYSKAARTIAEYPTEVELLVTENRLEEIPGVGKAIANKITELVNTGKLEFLDKLRADTAKRPS